MLQSAQTYTCILRFTAKTVYTSLLPLLSCVVQHCHTWREALPHLSRSTAATKVTVGADGVFIPIIFLPNISLLAPAHSSSSKIEKELSLSPSIIGLKPPSKSIDFPINPWGKRVQNSIREQLHWFSNFKKHLVHVLADGSVCYSWSLAPSQLGVARGAF